MGEGLFAQSAGKHKPRERQTMNIANIFQQQATQHPNAVAIIDTKHGRERRVTFAELEQTSARIATLLQQKGLQKGDAVLVFQTMSIELYSVLGALFRLGLMAVFVDPSAGIKRLEQCCLLYPIKGLIASPKAHLLRVVSSTLRRIPIKFSTGFWLPGATPLSAANSLSQTEPVACEVVAPALMTFTSGSTGPPKAAVRTHGFLIAQHQTLAKNLGLQAGEVDVSTLPIFVLANLASGVSSLIPNADLRSPGRVKAAPIVKQLQKHKPQRLSASPAFLERLIEHCDVSGEKLSSLQKIYTGGAPVFPHVLEQMQRVAPNSIVTAVYGSTEAEPIAHIAWHEMKDNDKQAMLSGKGLLTGKPVDDISLRIFKDQWGRAIPALTQETFNQLSVPSMQVGEIVVSGEHVLHGYLNGAGDEETKFNVGTAFNNTVRWHRTGDAGYLDEGGRLWLLGRCAAKIEDEHGVLYPFAAECAVYQHDAVKRAAAVLHKGKRWLLIEPKAGGHPDLEALQRSLAWAKFADIRLMTLPVDKRHNAKIDYGKLGQMLERPQVK
jgi:olefin beta-lactone synthetase